jgi:hypothetical protein
MLIEGLGDGRDAGIADPLPTHVSIDVGGITHKYGVLGVLAVALAPVANADPAE